MSKNIVKNATDFCEKNKHRLTEPRLAVLKIIISNKKPLGAYEILEKLGKVMDFWQEHGFIHRIESLNAYMACGEDHNHTGSQFMVCHDCGNVEEVHLCHLPKDIEQRVKSNGFKIAYWNAEISGQCEKCQ